MPANPIDTYLRRFPREVRARLQQVREAIAAEAPAAVEVLAYGIPTFDLHGRHLVHFAGYARHVGFYPAPSAMVAFRKDLAAYATAKGSVQFPLDSPPPLGLIRKMVRFRVAEEAANGKPPSPRRPVAKRPAVARPARKRSRTGTSKAKRSRPR